MDYHIYISNYHIIIILRTIIIDMQIHQLAWPGSDYIGISV